MNDVSDNCIDKTAVFGISPRIFLLLIILVALTLRVWGLDFGLPQVFHPDEPIVVTRACYGASENYWNPEAFHWPSLQIYLLGLEFKIWYWIGNLTGAWDTEEYSEIPPDDRFIAYSLRAPAGFYYLGRLTTALFGAGIAWLTFLLARRFFSIRVSLLCSLLVAINPIMASNSRYVTPDIPAEFFFLAALLYLDYLFSTLDKSRGLATNSGYQLQAFLLRPALIAAVLIGLGTGTKYPVGVLGFPLVAIILFTPSCMKFITRLILAFLSGVTSIVVFFITTPYALIEWDKFTNAIKEISEHVQGGEHIGMEVTGGIWLASLNGFLANSGSAWILAGIVGLMFFFASGFRRTWHILLALALVLLGIFPLKVFSPRYLIPLVPFLVLGIGWIINKLESHDSRPALVILIVFFSLMTGAGLFEALRALIPAYLGMPLAVIMVACFALTAVAGFLKRNTRAAEVTVLIIILALGGRGIYVLCKDAYNLTLPDTREFALEWVEKNIPAHSTIVKDQGGPDLNTDDLVPLSAEPWFFVTEITPLFSLHCIQPRPIENLLLANPDWVITSSYVRERYMREGARQRFPEIVDAFQEYYGFIEGELIEEARFSTGDGIVGEEIVIYRAIPDTRDLALAWVEENIPPHKTILMEPGGPDLYFVDPDTPDPSISGQPPPDPWYFVRDIHAIYQIGDEIQNPLETLVVTGPDWVITSSLAREGFTRECVQEQFPDLVSVFQEYDRLITNYLAEEIRFTPRDGMMGPEIVIYSVPEGLWDRVQLGSVQ